MEYIVHIQRSVQMITSLPIRFPFYELRIMDVHVGWVLRSSILSTQYNKLESIRINKEVIFQLQQKS